MQGHQRILEIVHATIYKGSGLTEPGTGNRVKVLFAFQPEQWLLEFENIFKVFQFMQLH